MVTCRARVAISMSSGSTFLVLGIVNVDAASKGPLADDMAVNPTVLAPENALAAFSSLALVTSSEGLDQAFKMAEGRRSKAMACSFCRRGFSLGASSFLSPGPACLEPLAVLAGGATVASATTTVSSYWLVAEPRGAN